MDPTGGRVEMAKVVAQLRGDQNAGAPEAMVELHKPVAGLVTSYANLDIASLASGVTEPVAVFQGFKDFEVSWKEDATPLVKAFKKDQAKLFVYEFVDHLMKTASGRAGPASYRDVGRRIEPEVMKDLIDWMTKKAEG